MEDDKLKIIENTNIPDEDLKLLINAGMTFLTQLPEIEQRKQEGLIRTKEIDKEIKLSTLLHIEKADFIDKKYSIIIMVLLLVVIFIFKKFDIVGNEKLDMVFLLLVSFIFTNAGKIWKTISKEPEKSNEV